MAGKLLHEELYRGADALARARDLTLVLCGAGAVGSNLADNLARQGFAQLRVIDDDRVEEHNVGTQLYGESDVGFWKADALRNRLFRATGVEVEAVRKRLTDQTAAALLKGAGVVVDAFDNTASRALAQAQCRSQGTPCLHVGLFEDYAEVLWDERYRVPRDVAGGDVCNYALARNLVLLAVAVASETLMAFLVEGRRTQWSVTLRDLAVRAVVE